MDQNERRVIDELFDKLRQAESQSGPRDGEAERHIAGRLSAQPGAPYYMAQAIIVQEQALAAAHTRIQELERELNSRPAGGGFLAGLFGGPRPDTSRPAASRPAASPSPSPVGHGYGAPPHAGHAAGPWGRSRGAGFLGGALQTAMAVAGGIVVGNMISDLLSPDPATAAEPEAAEDPAAQDPAAQDPAAEDPGTDEGGWGDSGGEEF